MNSQYEHQIFWSPDLSLLGDDLTLTFAQQNEKAKRKWIKESYEWERNRWYGIKSPNHKDQGQ